MVLLSALSELREIIAAGRKGCDDRISVWQQAPH